MAPTKESTTSGYGYGKRPLWQWIVLYLIIGGILYFVIYYFFFANKGYNYSNGSGSSNYNYQTE